MPLQIAATSSITSPVRHAVRVRIIGIPPPTAASKTKFTWFFWAISIRRAPLSATSALFDVVTDLPDSSMAFTNVKAGSTPPIVSTTIFTSLSFAISL